MLRFFNLFLIIIIILPGNICKLFCFENEGIINLTLKIKSSKIELLNLKVTTGKLKSIHRKINFNHEYIYIKAYLEEGELFYDNTILNPLINFVEYADTNGNFSNVLVEFDSITTLIRIPYHPDLRKIEFFEIFDADHSDSSFVPNMKKIESIDLDL
jgi:hypothetical protein